RGGAQHPAARPRGARGGRDTAPRGHRRGGKTRPLVCRGQGAGVRERGARRGGAGVGRLVRILLVNWNDRENPHAGGAEIHLHEIFGRLARQGHAIDLVTSGWSGAAQEGELDGLRVRRVGGRHTFALRARPAVRPRRAASRYDVVVEDINKLPLFLAGLTDRPFCALVPHLFGATAFREASWPIAAVVWAAERPIPRAYRRAWFHAISESTRDDLVRRGVPAERVEVIYPGVDASWYAPDAAVAGADAPAVAARVGVGLSQPEGRVGHLQHGGGGLRDARARVRQSGSAGVGPGRRDRVPRDARRRARAGPAHACAGRRSGARSAARPRGARLRGTPVVGARGAGDGGASATRHRAGRLTMRITITARHCELAPEVRARARALVERLARVAPRPQDARVVFDADDRRPA